MSFCGRQTLAGPLVTARTPLGIARFRDSSRFRVAGRLHHPASAPAEPRQQWPGIGTLCLIIEPAAAGSPGPPAQSTAMESGRKISATGLFDILGIRPDSWSLLRPDRPAPALDWSWRGPAGDQHRHHLQRLSAIFKRISDAPTSDVLAGDWSSSAAYWREDMHLLLRL